MRLARCARSGDVGGGEKSADDRGGRLVVGWLQRCAQWSIDAWAERPGKFRNLADDLCEYLVDAERPAGRTALAAAEFLFPLLEEPVDPETPLREWLSAFVDALGLEAILERSGIRAQDQEALADLLDVVLTQKGLVVQDFAGPVRRRGRIVVTTYHSSKGREFDAVILPGLQDGVMPSAWKPRGGRWQFSNIEDQLKLFYVGITRPRHTLVLLWSSRGENRYGDAGQWPRSRFLDAVFDEA